MIVCQSSGASIDADANRCGGCGAEVTEPTVGVSAKESPVLPAPSTAELAAQEVALARKDLESVIANPARFLASSLDVTRAQPARAADWRQETH